MLSDNSIGKVNGMGLFNFGKKARLLELQKLVIENSPNRLIMTEDQLITIAKEQVQNYIRIFDDSLTIAEKTMKPDVFFSRLELAENTIKHLTLFEPYLLFNGKTPSYAYNHIITNKDECIKDFITKYATFICEKANGMKTERGKKNQYEKFFDSMMPFHFDLSEENKKHFDMMYRRMIE